MPKSEHDLSPSEQRVGVNFDLNAEISRGAMEFSHGGPRHLDRYLLRPVQRGGSRWPSGRSGRQCI